MVELRLGDPHFLCYNRLASRPQYEKAFICNGSPLQAHIIYGTRIPLCTGTEILSTLHDRVADACTLGDSGGNHAYIRTTNRTIMLSEGPTNQVYR